MITWTPIAEITDDDKAQLNLLIVGHYFRAPLVVCWSHTRQVWIRHDGMRHMGNPPTHFARCNFPEGLK
jgi:hypothetical protein